MSEKRRDNKNRILRIGEQQRADGRYLFSTIDPITKKRKFVYSWKLETWRLVVYLQSNPNLLQASARDYDEGRRKQ